MGCHIFLKIADKITIYLLYQVISLQIRRNEALLYYYFAL